MTARLAKEIAEHIEEATNASRNGARDTSFFELKVAGVKATLYAAEQQRIANLIALTAHDHVNTGLYKVVTTDPDSMYPSFTTELNADVREGLGLA